MKFIKFPNGMVWPVDDDGQVNGIVLVPDYESKGSLEDRLDAIAEAATGSIIGLSDFSYRYHGGDYVGFTGEATEYLRSALDEEGDEGEFEAMDPASPEFRAALQQQYGLSDIEVDHALDNLDTDYGEECVVAVLDGMRSLLCPAYPEVCSYVRVVVDGYEVAYWSEDEWAQSPAEVMGALISALKRD